jgi:hypothetical protein
MFGIPAFNKSINGNYNNKYSIINKEWSELNDSEKVINQKYLDSKLRLKNTSEKINVLLTILKDPYSCYLPREYLFELKENIRDPLQKIATDSNINVESRAEALKILYLFKDKEIIQSISNDTLIKRPLSVVDEIERPGYFKFQKNYIELLYSATDSISYNKFLIILLKENICHYVVRKEIILKGESEINEIEKITENKSFDSFVRRNSLFILYNFKNPHSYSTTFRILSDKTENKKTRELAASLIGKIGNKENIPSLEKVNKSLQEKENIKISKALEKAIIEISKRGE